MQESQRHAWVAQREFKSQAARQKYRRKVRKEDEKAIEQQLSTTRKSPTFHETHFSLGYAYRKVGKL